MNIRKITGCKKNYCSINREERNYSAIFFAALCKPGNPKKFLKYFGYEIDIDPDNPDFGIYFEYAYLRDLWHKTKCEDTRKEIIRQNLKIKGINKILKLPLKEINRKFGASGEPSSKYLQSPGTWAITKYNKNFPDNDDFLKICKFKWSFNIKPDIVIHLDRNNAICIEAKYQSKEGTYPASGIEKRIFKDRNIEYVGQVELQKYMMKELLGIKTDFLFLVFKKQKNNTHKVLTWAEAFSSIKMGEMPRFAVEMVNNISKCGK